MEKIKILIAIFLTLLMTTVAFSPIISFAEEPSSQIVDTNKNWTFTVGKNPATEIPLDLLCGDIEPKDWYTNPSLVDFPENRNLPLVFNWHDSSKNPEGRDCV